MRHAILIRARRWGRRAPVSRDLSTRDYGSRERDHGERVGRLLYVRSSFATFEMATARGSALVRGLRSSRSFGAAHSVWSLQWSAVWTAQPGRFVRTRAAARVPFRACPRAGGAERERVVAPRSAAAGGRAVAGLTAAAALAAAAAAVGVRLGVVATAARVLVAGVAGAGVLVGVHGSLRVAASPAPCRSRLRRSHRQTQVCRAHYSPASVRRPTARREARDHSSDRAHGRRTDRSQRMAPSMPALEPQRFAWRNPRHRRERACRTDRAACRLLAR